MRIESRGRESEPPRRWLPVLPRRGATPWWGLSQNEREEIADEYPDWLLEELTRCDWDRVRCGELVRVTEDYGGSCWLPRGHDGDHLVRS